ncbi:alpha-soluble NSF attachment protein-like [Plectropomus leopardus]|uniref:alpha-soluble NSF attachment protein-like n=1 Tax=Plectropomus leopardus TaxID=160734 RepID=UPI001C4C0517|nr:alpha-soluble NSF attachment protein-like [Plectropomus leopardus]
MSVNTCRLRSLLIFLFSSANKCLLKVATYAAQLEQYPKAIEIYEQVGTHAMDSTLLKYSAKDHFFKAALCHFCVDTLNANLAVRKYEEMFPAFSDSRECKLLKVGCGVILDLKSTNEQKHRIIH